MNEKPRQRRPAFDREQGIAIAQALFHQRGFDAVSLADLTEAMNIKPPSFYAAYGSKAELFERAMHRYAGENALPVDKLLAPDRPPAEALTARAPWPPLRSDPEPGPSSYPLCAPGRMMR